MKKPRQKPGLNLWISLFLKQQGNPPHKKHAQQSHRRQRGDKAEQPGRQRLGRADSAQPH